jgi:hypothetical protein
MKHAHLKFAVRLRRIADAASARVSLRDASFASARDHFGGTTPSWGARWVRDAIVTVARRGALTLDVGNCSLGTDNANLWEPGKA